MFINARILGIFNFSFLFMQRFKMPNYLLMIFFFALFNRVVYLFSLLVPNQYFQKMASKKYSGYFEEKVLDFLFEKIDNSVAKSAIQKRSRTFTEVITFG